MFMRAAVVAALLALASAPSAYAQDDGVAAEPRSTDYRAAALMFPELVNSQYAYLERFPDSRFSLTSRLQQEAQAVEDARDLLVFLERATLLLADHHAITGSSFSDSWVVMPSYSDLWIEREGEDYVITAVREGSPAALANIAAGDLLAMVGGVPVDEAVTGFWADLGLEPDEMQRAFAARVLAAGRRGRSRELTVISPEGARHPHELASMYAQPRTDGLLDVSRHEGEITITFADSLGQSATIAALDNAMAQAAPDDTVILDLTETPSGGNTMIARGIMGWFTRQPTPYQMHELPSEERQSGIARSWLELVEPRENKYHPGPVVVRVGRWTGSMGEGLALGMAELGACIEGDRMAGLLGAIGDFEIGGITVKLPFERLFSIEGIPREDFAPITSCAD